MFLKDVWPIFEARCLECHGPKKQKGDLRMGRIQEGVSTTVFRRQADGTWKIVADAVATEPGGEETVSEAAEE